MVSINQIRNGVTRYADNDLIPGQSGITRAVVKGVVNLYAAKADEIIHRLSEIPAISVLQVIDGDMVDIDTLYQCFAPEVQGRIEIKIPLVGTMSFDREEIDKIVRRIREA